MSLLKLADASDQSPGKKSPYLVNQVFNHIFKRFFSSGTVADAVADLIQSQAVV
jgi:hypothetical protein